MVLIIKKWISGILAALLLLSLSPCAFAEGAPSTHAQCALLMGGEGTVLYAQQQRKD